MKTFTVIYQNGTKVVFRAKDLKIIRYQGGHMEISWEGIEPHCVLFGIDHIVAIWEGKV